MNPVLIKRPSAFLPLILSLAALALVLVHAAIHGVVHGADEGTAAHVFQLLMAAQVPVMAFFVLRWMPREPGPALRILALQAGAALTAVIAVILLT